MGTPMAQAAKKLTYADYCRIPDDGKRHELVDGVEYVSPAPADRHQVLIGNVYHALRVFLDRTRIGVARLSPLDVLLGRHSVVQPDVLVVLAANLARLKRNGCHGPPDLAIEVLSPSNPEHDVVRKRRLYEKHGVPEYWVVDPAVGRVDVYRLGPSGRYPPPLVLFVDQAAVLETQLLPGFAAGLVALFDPGLLPAEQG